MTMIGIYRLLPKWLSVGLYTLQDLRTNNNKS